MSTCDASDRGYDGLWGIGCDLPKGHDGPHRDDDIEWRHVCLVPDCKETATDWVRVEWTNPTGSVSVTYEARCPAHTQITETMRSATDEPQHGPRAEG